MNDAGGNAGVGQGKPRPYGAMALTYAVEALSASFRTKGQVSNLPSPSGRCFEHRAGLKPAPTLWLL